MSFFENYYEFASKLRFQTLKGYAKLHKLDVEIIAVLDFFGATNSAKDRLARGMLTIAKEQGKLAPRGEVVEASHSTFATALTIAGGNMGHPVHLVMPQAVPLERQNELIDLGAKIVLTNQVYGLKGTSEKAMQLAKSLNGYFVDYMSNDDNLEHHRKTTGPQLLKVTDSKFDFFVAGVGSGGTLSGTAEYIKAWTNGISIVAVQPFENQVLTGGFPGKHGIDGIGANFIPSNFNPYIVDEIVSVNTADSARAALEVTYTDGVPVSIAGGAALNAAKLLAQKPENKGKRFVVMFSGKKVF